MKRWLSVLAVTALMIFTACELEDKNLSPTDNAEGVCKLTSGESIDVGQSVEAPDGCNTCSCDEAGRLACTEMACLDEDPTAKEGPGELVACTMDYTPVCGYDATGNAETYSNACVAKSKGIVKTYEGECKEEAKDKVDTEKVCTFKTVEKEVECLRTPCEPVEEKVYYWTTIETAKKMVTVDKAFCESESNDYVCTEEYAPVCGLLNEAKKTYGNACKAKMAKATVVSEGNCDEVVIEQPPEVIACMALWAPVCAKTTEGELKTFGNDCEAGVAQAKVLSEGECPIDSIELR